jgi:hypothetical protein
MSDAITRNDAASRYELTIGRAGLYAHRSVPKWATLGA